MESKKPFLQTCIVVLTYQTTQETDSLLLNRIPKAAPTRIVQSRSFLNLFQGGHSTASYVAEFLPLLVVLQEMTQTESPTHPTENCKARFQSIGAWNPAARSKFLYLANAGWNPSITLPTGPLRCFAIITSASCTSS